MGQVATYDERTGFRMRRTIIVGFFLALLSVQSASAQTTATSPTLAHIRQTGTLRIAYRPDAAPFSYKGTGADPTGFMITLCQAVAAQLPQLANLPQVNVTYVPVTSVNRFDVIRNGGADLLCDSTSMTIERRKIVDFSIPTFVDGAGLLVRGSGIANISALAGQKIAVLAGTTTQAALSNTLSSANITATVIPAPTYLEGLKMLDAGTVSAFFGDRAILLNLIPQSSAPSQLALADNYLTIEPYALAMRHGDEDFRLVVDQALSRIYRSGRIAAVFKSTFGETPTAGALLMYNIVAYPE